MLSIEATEKLHSAILAEGESMIALASVTIKTIVIELPAPLMKNKILRSSFSSQET